MSAGGHPGAPPPEPPLPSELGPAAAAPPDGSPPDGSFWADWQALLRNRLILAGMALLIVLLLVTVVLVFLGPGDDATDDGAAVTVNTPAQSPTPLPPGSVIGRMRTTASVLAGPDPRFTPMGTIRRGVVLEIVGRSEDDAWLQVIYPPGSTLRGWVDRTLLDVTGNVSLLRVAGPALGPNVQVPTSSFVELPTFEEPTFEVSESTPTPTKTHAPTATPIRVRSATPTPNETAAPP